MITAQEARALTEQAAVEMVPIYCEKAIKAAISHGKYKTTVDLHRCTDCRAIAKSLIKALRKLGYKADYYCTGSQWDPDLACDLIIEW